MNDDRRIAPTPASGWAPPQASTIRPPVPAGVSAPPWAVDQQPPHVPTPPPPAAPHSGKAWSKKRTLALFVGLMTLTVVFIGGAAFLLSRLSINAATNNVPAEAFIGECFGFDETKTAVACDGQHFFEVFSAVEYPADMEYPNVAEIAIGNQICTDEFTEYTGEGYYTSDYDYQEVFPSRAQWDAGERIVICVIHHYELDPIGRTFPGR